MSAEGQPDGGCLQRLNAMGGVAVAHKGIVESAITWSSETSNLAKLF